MSKRYCADCVHCNPGWLVFDAKCMRPDNKVIDVVTGYSFTIHCHSERTGKSSETRCGRDGRFFEDRNK